MKKKLAVLLALCLFIQGIGWTAFAGEVEGEGGSLVEEPVVEETVAVEPVVEEPVVEAAVVEEPVVEAAVVEEPVVEEPVVEAAVVEEPVVEEPVVEAAVAEEPVAEEPVVEAAVAEEPVAEEPVVEEPVAEEPVAEEPVAEEPVVEEPVAEEPVVEEPVAEEPVAEEPVAEEPVVEEPVVEEPVAEEPVAEEPVVEEPVAEEPVVEEPVAEEPVAEENVFAAHLVRMAAGRAIYEAVSCYNRQAHELKEDAIVFAEEELTNNDGEKVWKVTYALDGELITGYVLADEAQNANAADYAAEAADTAAYRDLYLPNVAMKPTPDEVKAAEEAAAQKAAEEAAAAQKAAEEAAALKAAEEAAAAQKAAEEAAAQKAAEEAAAAQKAAEEAAALKAAEEAAAAQKAAEEAAAAQKAAEEAAAAQKAAEEAAALKAAEEAAAAQKAAEEAAAAQKAAEEAAALKAAEEAAAAQKAAEEAAALKAAEEAAAAQKAAEEVAPTVVVVEEFPTAVVVEEEAAAEETIVEPAAETVEDTAEEKIAEAAEADEAEVIVEGTTEEIVDELANELKPEEEDLLTEASETISANDFIVERATGKLLEYKGTATDIVIPVSVAGVTITGIDESAFAEMRSSITSVLLHQATGLTDIDQGCFRDCTALKSVSFPNSVQYLAADVFKGCTSLSAISWPDSLQEIGNHAFDGCTSLTSVVLPATVTYIGDFAFSGCTSVVKLTLDNATDVWIGASAFANCTALEGIYLPDAVTYIGNSAFEYCTAATALSLPRSLTEIKNFVFRGCTKLKTVLVPSGVTTIGREAFYNCSSITRVDIPASVTNIGSYAFYGVASDVTFFVEPRSAVLGTDALGLNGTVVAFVNSTTHTYVKNHSGMTFVSMAIVDYVHQLYLNLFNRNVDRPGLVTYSTELASKSKTVGAVIGEMLSNTEYTRRNLDSTATVDAIFGAMLGRAPTDEELDTGLTMLGNGVTVRSVGNFIAGGDEFKNLCNAYAITPGTVPALENRDRNYNVTAFVARSYRNILGRNFDVAGLNSWTGRLLDGQAAGADIVLGFVGSAEFSKLNLSNSEIVNRMYITMLNREPDASGRANWIASLNAGARVEAIVAGFVGSYEFRALCSRYGIQAGSVDLSQPTDQMRGITDFLKRCYTEALGRDYDPVGLEQWTQLLVNRQATPAQVAYGFVFSDEVVLKGLNNTDFAKMLYRLYLGRNADAAGLADWVRLLNSGVARTTMVDLFASSAEFARICQSFGLN